MKVITEALIRVELKATNPDVYYIPEGKILSPAAREYLQQQKIDIDVEKNRAKRELGKNKTVEEVVKKDEALKAINSFKYLDYETGAGYHSKPEYMTQIFGNQLVEKSHPRIAFRGKLDRLQSDIVYAQTVIIGLPMGQGIVKDLDEILCILREIMRCEVLNEPFCNDKILGLSHDELRDHSHHPMKYYKIENMLLPNYSMGTAYALINVLRSTVRELEVIGVSAFKNGRKIERADILEELNRLSSALHIMMCKYLSKGYEPK